MSVRMLPESFLWGPKAKPEVGVAGSTIQRAGVLEIKRRKAESKWYNVTSCLASSAVIPPQWWTVPSHWVKMKPFCPKLLYQAFFSHYTRKLMNTQAIMYWTTITYQEPWSTLSGQWCMLVVLQFGRRKTETLSQSCRVCETLELTFFAITWLPQTILFLAFEVQALHWRTGWGEGWWPERSPWVQRAASTFSWWQLTKCSARYCGSCHFTPSSITKWAENKEEENKQGLLLDWCGSSFLLPFSLQSLPFQDSLSLEHGEGPCELSSLCLWSTVWQLAA